MKRSRGLAEKGRPKWCIADSAVAADTAAEPVRLADGPDHLLGGKHQRLRLQERPSSGTWPRRLRIFPERTNVAMFVVGARPGFATDST